MMILPSSVNTLLIFPSCFFSTTKLITSVIRSQIFVDIRVLSGSLHRQTRKQASDTQQKRD